MYELYNENFCFMLCEMMQKSIKRNFSNYKTYKLHIGYVDDTNTIKQQTKTNPLFKKTYIIDNICNKQLYIIYIYFVKYASW